MTKGKSTEKKTAPVDTTVIAAPAEEIVRKLEETVQPQKNTKKETSKMGVIDWGNKGDMPYYLL